MPGQTQQPTKYIGFIAPPCMGQWFLCYWFSQVLLNKNHQLFAYLESTHEVLEFLKPLLNPWLKGWLLGNDQPGKAGRRNKEAQKNLWKRDTFYGEEYWNDVQEPTGCASQKNKANQTLFLWYEYKIFLTSTSFFPQMLSSNRWLLFLRNAKKRNCM